LIIDDAGKLIPGLIQLIIEHTSGIYGLTIIFALTPDELFLKNSSDPAINDAYFIEVPPLSEQQCHEFICYLANHPSAHRSLNGFIDNSVAKIYRETHGVPGKMIAALSSQEHIKNKDHAPLMLVAAVTVLVAITFGIQWASSSQIL
jgi:DamX protein